MWWFIRQIASSKQGGFFEFKPMYISQIPISTAIEPEREEIETLVQKCLDAKGKDVKHIETEIDQLVYQLYELTEAEIKIVEG